MRRVLLTACQMLRTPLVAAAFAVLVMGTALPWAYSSQVPHYYASGVVQPTGAHSTTVVHLDDGRYVAAEDVSAHPGQRVTLYYAPGDPITASRGVGYAVLAGVGCLVVGGFVIFLLLWSLNGLLERITHLLEKGLPSQRR